MKNITLFKSNGGITTKNEAKITLKDLATSEYILSPTDNSVNPDYRNFAIVPSSEYLFFDLAVIDYQLAAFYTDIDNDDEPVDFQPIDPIHMETNSICDLICILNGIDKFNLVNNLLRENFSPDNSDIGLVYLGIQLFRNNKVIYSKYYERKPTSKNMYVSYKVAKKFSDIYDDTLCYTMNKNNERLYIYKKENTMYWKIGISIKDCEFIGIPLLQSNTITLCSPNEFDILTKYKKVEVHFELFFARNATIAKISEDISSGEYLEKIYDFIDDTDADIYIDNHNVEYIGKRKCEYILDILSHIYFIIETANLIFSEIYPFDVKFIDDDQEEPEEEEVCAFDSVLGFRMHDTLKNSHHYKEFIMNRYSLMSLSSILQFL